MDNELKRSTEGITEDSTNSTDNSEGSSESGEIIQRQQQIIQDLQETIKKQTESIGQLLDAVKLNAIREVPPIEEVKGKVMTPTDHINKIYEEVVERSDTLKTPPPLKDYEECVYILKKHNIPEHKIASFLTNTNYDKI